MKRRLLRVLGPSFCAGVIFEKVGGVWQMTDCAPYLRKIIGRTPIGKIGDLLNSKGFEYEWL